jgi:hypothetical protein
METLVRLGSKSLMHAGHSGQRRASSSICRYVWAMLVNQRRKRALYRIDATFIWDLID